MTAGAKSAGAVEEPLPVQELARVNLRRRLRLKHVVARAGDTVAPKKRALLAVRKSNARRGSPPHQADVARPRQEPARRCSSRRRRIAIVFLVIIFAEGIPRPQVNSARRTRGRAARRQARPVPLDALLLDLPPGNVEHVPLHCHRQGDAFPRAVDRRLERIGEVHIQRSRRELVRALVAGELLRRGDAPVHVLLRRVTLDPRHRDFPRRTLIQQRAHPGPDVRVLAGLVPRPKERVEPLLELPARGIVVDEEVHRPSLELEDRKDHVLLGTV